MRVPCVGAVVTDPEGRLLLVRRAHPPGAGRWSIPGGRVEPKETEPAAVAREVREETGLEVTVGRRVGEVERGGAGGVVYAITDYACTVIGGALRAGDDAADVRWIPPEELATLPLVDGLVDALASWGLLPRPSPSPPLPHTGDLDVPAAPDAGRTSRTSRSAGRSGREVTRGVRRGVVIRRRG